MAWILEIILMQEHHVLEEDIFRGWEIVGKWHSLPYFLFQKSIFMIKIIHAYACKNRSLK